MTTLFTLHFDGCCKKNPGPCGVGSVLYNGSKEEVECISLYIGEKQTNNYAEYCALEQGLIMANKYTKTLRVKGDSLLVINQMKRIWKVKHPNLVSVHFRCQELASKFEDISFEHVERSFNKRADQLANDGLLNQLRIQHSTIS